MSAPDKPTALKSVRFRNYKGLKDFTVRLKHMNILVGPNNSGKSTILSAFRILAAGIKLANARRPEVYPGPAKVGYGYKVNTNELPFSFENVHTNLSEDDTLIDFELGNGAHLYLKFPQDGGCYFFCIKDGISPNRPTQFKRFCPISINHIPVLGPLDYEEELLQVETVNRGLNTHRASAHFRNYWNHHQQDFPKFAELLKQTWPGMTVSPPEINRQGDPTLFMFCTENRHLRELFWAGFGFQVWCQLLTHMCRSREADLLIVDEPEIYLHPDLQRQLIGLLRELGPDIILATHSSEIVNEADPRDILLVQKDKTSAQRITSAPQAQVAFDLLGSSLNVTLTQLARNRRIVFVEGNDFAQIRRFSRRLGYVDLANGNGVTFLPIGGFSAWTRLKSIAWAFQEALGQGTRIRFGAILDRDFRCDEEIARIKAEVADGFEFVHVHSRKEIENYLLVPAALDRAIASAVLDRVKRDPDRVLSVRSAAYLLDEVTQALHDDAQGQYAARRHEFLKTGGKDLATIVTETNKWFAARWSTLDTRVEIIPGKACLTAFFRKVQDESGLSLHQSRLAEAIRPTEVASDLRELIEALERFRK